MATHKGQNVKEEEEGLPASTAVAAEVIHADEIEFADAAVEVEEEERESDMKAGSLCEHTTGSSLSRRRAGTCPALTLHTSGSHGHYCDVTHVDPFARSRVVNFLRRTGQTHNPLFELREDEVWLNQASHASCLAPRIRTNTANAHDATMSTEKSATTTTMRIHGPGDTHATSHDETFHAKVQRSDGSTSQRVYIATCRLVLPPPHALYVAEGMAEKAKDAELLAAMHAERICDALGVPLFSLPSRQQRYAATVRVKERRYAPFPGDPVRPEGTPVPAPLRMLSAKLTASFATTCRQVRIAEETGKGIHDHCHGATARTKTVPNEEMQKVEQSATAMEKDVVRTPLSRGIETNRVENRVTPHASRPAESGSCHLMCENETKLQDEETQKQEQHGHGGACESTVDMKKKKKNANTNKNDTKSAHAEANMTLDREHELPMPRVTTCASALKANDDDNNSADNEANVDGIDPPASVLLAQKGEAAWLSEFRAAVHYPWTRRGFAGGHHSPPHQHATHDRASSGDSRLSDGGAYKPSFASVPHTHTRHTPSSHSSCSSSSSSTTITPSWSSVYHRFDPTECGTWQMVNTVSTRCSPAPHDALVLPSVYDPGALDRVTDYFLQHGLSLSARVHYTHVNAAATHTSARMYEATLPLADPLSTLCARGKATRKDTALCLAAMHAELLLDALGQPLFPADVARQRRHARAARRFGRRAPLMILSQSATSTSEEAYKDEEGEEEMAVQDDARHVTKKSSVCMPVMAEAKGEDSAAHCAKGDGCTRASAAAELVHEYCCVDDDCCCSSCCCCSMNNSNSRDDVHGNVYAEKAYYCLAHTGAAGERVPTAALPLPLKQQCDEEEEMMAMMRTITTRTRVTSTSIGIGTSCASATATAPSYNTSSAVGRFDRSESERIVAAHVDWHTRCGDMIAVHMDPALGRQARRILAHWQRRIVCSPLPALYLITRMGVDYCRATTLTPLPRHYGVRGGQAMGRDAEEAMGLCALHALDGLCALGIPVFDQVAQQRRWEEQRRGRGWVSCPRDVCARTDASKCDALLCDASWCASSPLRGVSSSSGSGASVNKTTQRALLIRDGYETQAQDEDTRSNRARRTFYYMPGYLADTHAPRCTPHVGDVMHIRRLNVWTDLELCGGGAAAVSEETLTRMGNDCKTCVQCYLKQSRSRAAGALAKTVHTTSRTTSMSTRPVPVCARTERRCVSDATLDGQAREAWEALIRAHGSYLSPQFYMNGSGRQAGIYNVAFLRVPRPRANVRSSNSNSPMSPVSASSLQETNVSHDGEESNPLHKTEYDKEDKKPCHHSHNDNDTLGYTLDEVAAEAVGLGRDYVLAVGVSMRRKDAERMCFLHAARLLHALGEDVVAHRRVGLPRHGSPASCDDVWRALNLSAPAEGVMLPRPLMHTSFHAYLHSDHGKAAHSLGGAGAM